MRKITTALLLLIATLVAAQSTTRQDSLLNIGRMWRDNHNFEMAIDQFLRAGGDEAEYEMALTHYYMGKISMALSESKSIAKRGNNFSLDAEVLTALCRESQGFERAAIRIYKNATAQGSSRAAYHYAAMLLRKGHRDEAEQWAQKSIMLNKNNADAHLLLATVMTEKNERFKSMMPIYYFLLINNDEEKQRLAYRQLISLWRESAKAINLIKTCKVPDPFNDAINRQIEQWTTSDSIAKVPAKEQITMLCQQTERLFRYLLETSELNLDFWQVTYTDFFVKFVTRNFVTPYVYYIADAEHHADVLVWTSSETYLFNEFRLWMEAQ